MNETREENLEWELHYLKIERQVHIPHKVRADCLVLKAHCGIMDREHLHLTVERPNRSMSLVVPHEEYYKDPRAAWAPLLQWLRER